MTPNRTQKAQTDEPPRRIPVRIPEPAKADLAALASLSSEAAESLERALRHAKPSMSAKVLAAQISPEVKMDPEVLHRLVRLLYSLYGARERYAADTDDFVGEVAERAAEEGIGGLTKGSSSADAFRARLKRFLSLDDSIGVGAKAHELILEHDRPFEDVRVITDIRAVFGGTSGEPKPVAAMVYHTLKIAAHGEEGHKTYFFALDGNEIRVLRAALERATLKETALRELVAKTNLPLIDILFD